MADQYRNRVVFGDERLITQSGNDAVNNIGLYIDNQTDYINKL
jgi:hypothetical protein